MSSHTTSKESSAAPGTGCVKPRQPASSVGPRVAQRVGAGKTLTTTELLLGASRATTAALTGPGSRTRHDIKGVNQIFGSAGIFAALAGEPGLPKRHAEFLAQRADVGAGFIHRGWPGRSLAGVIL